MTPLPCVKPDQPTGCIPEVHPERKKRLIITISKEKEIPINIRLFCLIFNYRLPPVVMLRYRVIAAFMKWITAGDTLCSPPTALQQTIFIDRFVRVMRTSRWIAALRRHYLRYRRLIDFYHPQSQWFHLFNHYLCSGEKSHNRFLQTMIITLRRWTACN